MVAVLDTEALQQKQAQARLIDVRDQASFDRGHIEGAYWMSYDTLAEKGAKTFSRQEALILYDNGKQDCRAAETALALEEQGFEQVFVYEGGWTEWQSYRAGVTSTP